MLMSKTLSLYNYKSAELVLLIDYNYYYYYSLINITATLCSSVSIQMSIAMHCQKLNKNDSYWHADLIT